MSCGGLCVLIPIPRQTWEEVCKFGTTPVSASCLHTQSLSYLTWRLQCTRTSPAWALSFSGRLLVTMSPCTYACVAVAKLCQKGVFVTCGNEEGRWNTGE